jgi:hypothetical protein
LSHNNLSEAKSISKIISISKLHELDLSSNKLDGEYVAFLDILHQCKHLKVLSLKGMSHIYKVKVFSGGL